MRLAAFIGLQSGVFGWQPLQGSSQGYSAGSLYRAPVRGIRLAAVIGM